MAISLTKMQAQGNDFIILDLLSYDIALTQKDIQHIAHRKYGIGCDQVLILAPSDRKNNKDSKNRDFKYRIFNQDGSESSQCGNGARCLGYYIHRYHNNQNNQWRLITPDDTMIIKYISHKIYGCELAIPQFTSASIPTTLTFDKPTLISIPFQSNSYQVSLVNVGNPHAIIVNDHGTKIPLADISHAWCNAGYFPQGINISAMTMENSKHIHLSTYERGVGPTLACGSGACAAAITAQLYKNADSIIQVKQPGGSVQVTWNGYNSVVILQGEVHEVFKTTWEIPCIPMNNSKDVIVF